MPVFDIINPVPYYPVGGLHGKLTVTAKLAPGCPATRWRVRPAHSFFAPFRNPPRTGWWGIGCWAFDVGCWMFPISPAIKANQGLSSLIKANGENCKRRGGARSPDCPPCLPPRTGSRFPRQIQPNQSKSSQFKPVSLSRGSYFAVAAPCLGTAGVPALWAWRRSGWHPCARAQRFTPGYDHAGIQPQSGVKTRKNPFKFVKIKIYQESTIRWNPDSARPPQPPSADICVNLRLKFPAPISAVSRDQDL